MSQAKSVTIHIPQPCTQNWDEMTPDVNGRHCSNCSKTVIDFTTWTDAALFNFFANNNSHVCGRYLATQVDRPINIRYQPHSRLYRIVIAMGLTLMVVQAPDALGQSNAPKTQQCTFLLPGPAGVRYGAISGVVTDNKNEPEISVAIMVYQNGILKGGNVTDYDGKYTLQPLEPGIYEVFAIQQGYDSATANSVLVVSDEITVQDFRIIHKNRPLRTTIIVGYRKPLIDQKQPAPQQDKNFEKNRPGKRTFTKEELDHMR